MTRFLRERGGSAAASAAARERRDVRGTEGRQAVMKGQAGTGKGMMPGAAGEESGRGAACD